MVKCRKPKAKKELKIMKILLMRFHTTAPNILSKAYVPYRTIAKDLGISAGKARLVCLRAAGHLKEVKK